jgi:putative ABC transport system substrate-binding protein
MRGPEPDNPYVRAFLAGMRERGYVYGVHFVTEPRGGEGNPERFPSLVAELIALKPDVIIAPGPVLPWLKQANVAVPIVMTASSDPVEQGYVESLAQSGTNFTGLSLQSIELTGKRIELLKELVPSIGSIGVIWDRSSQRFWRAAESSALSLGLTLISLEIRDPREIEDIFKTATDARAHSLLVFAAGHLFGQRKQVAELAARNRLPAMYELREYVEAGGLISYSANLLDIWQRAASFVDRILKGARPGELPIEQPTEFELLINLKAARALDISVSPTLLARANEVIE